MKIFFLLISAFIVNVSSGQIATKPKSFLTGFFTAKGYSKEISIYRAKDFLMKEIIKTSNNVVKFKLDALAAAATGELTTLVYECEEQNKSGLILGFYNDYWNDNGVTYQGYRFKNIEKDSAVALLAKIEKISKEYTPYLRENLDQNNICFTYDDLTFLISEGWGEIHPIRIFWDNFDVEWDASAFSKTQKKFETKLDNK